MSNLERRIERTMSSLKRRIERSPHARVRKRAIQRNEALRPQLTPAHLSQRRPRHSERINMRIVCARFLYSSTRFRSFQWLFPDPDAVRFVIDIVFICVTRHQVFTRSVAKFFSFFFSDHTALCTVGTITLISFWGHGWGCVIRQRRSPDPSYSWFCHNEGTVPIA